MKVWELKHEKMDWVTFSSEDKWTYEYLQSFDGRRKAAEWKPLYVESDQKAMGLPYTDYPGFQHAVLKVFSGKAINALLPLIRNDVEVLPLITTEGDFSAINVINTCDCIDYTNSEYILFRSSGRIMEFTKLVFMEDKLAGSHIFRLPDGPHFVYVSDEFREAVEKNGLTGFRFILAWDSEAEKNK